MKECNCYVHALLKHDEDADIPERHKMIHLYCNELNAYRCRKTDCPCHKDFKA